MSVTIIGSLPCNGSKDWCYVGFDEDGGSVEFTGTVPCGLADTEQQDYADLMENAWRYGALNRMYPGAKHVSVVGSSPLESFRAWIKAGHKNVTEMDGEQIETVIEKVLWSGKHPDGVYQIASLDFMDRFTDGEAAAAYGSQDVKVKIILSKLSAARQIDFRNQTLIDSMNYLVSVSILSQARATEIMTR